MAKILARGVTFNSNHLSNNAGTLELAAAVSSLLHTQNADTKLAEGTGNEVTAAAIRAFIDSKAANSGLASLDSNGKLPTTQLPGIAMTSFLGAVASQAAMLALSGEAGDWCTRTDTGTTYIITGSDPTQLGSWTQILTPASSVVSVNGETGAVTLTGEDIGVSSAQFAATNVKAALEEAVAEAAAAQSTADGAATDAAAAQSTADGAATAAAAAQSDADTALTNAATAQSAADGAATDAAAAQSTADSAAAAASTAQTDATNAGNAAAAAQAAADAAQTDADAAQTDATAALARSNIKRQFITLTSGQVAAKAVTLANTPTGVGVISVNIRGIGLQFPTTDFSLVGDDIDWNSGEGMDSLSLATGDKLYVEYEI